MQVGETAEEIGSINITSSEEVVEELPCYECLDSIIQQNGNHK